MRKFSRIVKKGEALPILFLFLSMLILMNGCGKKKSCGASGCAGGKDQSVPSNYSVIDGVTSADDGSSTVISNPSFAVHNSGVGGSAQAATSSSSGFLLDSSANAN